MLIVYRVSPVTTPNYKPMIGEYRSYLFGHARTIDAAIQVGGPGHGLDDLPFAATEQKWIVFRIDVNSSTKGMHGYPAASRNIPIIEGRCIIIFHRQIVIAIVGGH